MIRCNKLEWGPRGNWRQLDTQYVDMCARARTYARLHGLFTLHIEDELSN